MKIPFVDYNLYTTVINSEPILSVNPEVIDTNTAVILTKSRSSTIVTNFVGHTISVYNGRTLNELRSKN